MNQLPIKQHFVPQTYLNQFAGTDKQFYKLKKDRPKFPLRKFSVSQVCYRDNFFTVNTSSQNMFSISYEDKFLIEKTIFSYYENTIEKTIKKIRKREQTLPLKNAKKFIKSLLNIKHRNPSFREQYEKINTNKYIEEHLEEITQEKDIWINLLKSQNLSFEDFLLTIKKEADNWTQSKSFSQDLHNSSLIKAYFNSNYIINQIANDLLSYQWHIMETTVAQLFITSDNPGFSVNENQQIFNAKFAEKFIFLFPISPLHVLEHV